MWHKFPRKKYLLRSLSIINVTEVGSIRFSEHTISLLTNSYYSTGGLCGAIGGDKGSESRARQTCNDDIWRIGNESLINQNVYNMNRDSMKKQLSERQMFEMYSEEGSEFNLLEQQQALKEQAENDLREACELAKESSEFTLSLSPFYIDH